MIAHCLFEQSGTFKNAFKKNGIEAFEGQVLMFLDGHANGQQKWSDNRKVEYALKMHGELNDMYQRICKLFLICYDRGLKLVVENPWNNGLNYLCKYFPVKAKLIDKNRRDNGDYYQKPTQFWFVNCEPKGTLLFESLEECELLNIAYAKANGKVNRQVVRSMIHPQYADRFIRQYIL